MSIKNSKKKEEVINSYSKSVSFSANHSLSCLYLSSFVSIIIQKQHSFLFLLGVTTVYIYSLNYQISLASFKFKEYSKYLCTLALMLKKTNLEIMRWNMVSLVNE